MKDLIKSLRESKKQLSRIAKAMPDKEEYGIPYCILMDMLREINDGMKHIRPAMKQAKYESKKCRK